MLIVIPTYNRVAWLKECIESFLAQTVQDFELIVLDNASDQDVEGLISSFKDPRISLIRNEKHLPIQENHWKAFDMAAGDFFMVFHDDDCVNPKMLETQLRIFAEIPEILFVVTACNLVWDRSKMMDFDARAGYSYEVFEDHRALVKAYLSGQPFGYCSTLYRSSALKGLRPYLERLWERFSHCTDRALLISLAGAGPCAYLKEPNYNAYQHDTQDSATLALSEHCLMELFRLYRKQLNTSWDPLTEKRFNYMVTRQLLTIYKKGILSRRLSVSALLRHSLTKGLISPLDFFRCSIIISIDSIIRRLFRRIHGENGKTLRIWPTKRSENKLKNYRNAFYRWLAPIADPGKIMRGILNYLRFIKDWADYSRLEGAEPMRFIDSAPYIYDRTETTVFDNHYFYQDIWAFRKIYESKASYHVDVGSRIDFVGFLTAVTKVLFIDIRPLMATLDSLEPVAGSVLSLPFRDNSVVSLSCLHVAEHIGLGRYGDQLNPHGTREATRELNRVLARGGNLLFSVPVGKPRLCFNAHRIHSPTQICEYFPDLELVELSGINDSGVLVRNANLVEFADQVYACGLFWFRKL